MSTYKKGTVADVTYEALNKNKVTSRALLLSSNFWCLENSIRIPVDSPNITKVTPLRVLDTKNLDLQEMLSDLTGVRDKLKYLTSLVTMVFPTGKTTTQDIWSTVCDLVDAFSELTEEQTSEPPVEQPGMGGIIEVDGERISRGVDGLWRDSMSRVYPWSELISAGHTVTVISPGID